MIKRCALFLGNTLVAMVLCNTGPHQGPEGECQVLGIHQRDHSESHLIWSSCVCLEMCVSAYHHVCVYYQTTMYIQLLQNHNNVDVSFLFT